jgi:hypothetical protein
MEMGVRNVCRRAFACATSGAEPLVALASPGRLSRQGQRKPSDQLWMKVEEPESSQPIYSPDDLLRLLPLPIHSR